MKEISSQAILLFFLLCLGCGSKFKSLPYLGESEEIDGKMQYYRVPPFQFIDQDSNMVSDQTLSGNAYIADFFFTSCPTICPKVKTQMLRLREQFQDRNDLKFLSMSIDYRKDSVPRLKKYAEKLGIESESWHLVQLKKEEINAVANQFFNVAFEDESAPGGFDHSGRLILIDGQGHIRSYCDGTDPDSVDKLAGDIRILFHEMD
jgi:protein SCO1/2